jgi:hypothetical protein
MKNIFVIILEFSFHIPSQFSPCLKQKLTIQNMAETKVSEQMKEMFMSQITLRLFQEPNKTRKDKSLLINDVNNSVLLRCVTHYLFTFVGATTSTSVF